MRCFDKIFQKKLNFFLKKVLTNLKQCDIIIKLSMRQRKRLETIEIVH